MEVMLIRPKTKEQLIALKALAKALNVDFEITDSADSYNPEFVAKILQGREDVKKGKGVKIPIEDLWK